MCLSSLKKEVSSCWMPSRCDWIASPASWMTRRTGWLFESWQPTIQSYFYRRGGRRHFAASVGAEQCGGA